VIEVLAVVDNMQQDRVDQRSCTHCGQRSHGKYPDIDLRKTDCPAYGKKCAKCQQKGHYAGVCKSRRGVKKYEAQQDSNHWRSPSRTTSRLGLSTHARGSTYFTSEAVARSILI
jgi:hypothetical protein